MKLLIKPFLYHVFTFGMSVFLLVGCKNNSEDDEVQVSKQLLLLKVDYLTHDFEGGQNLEMAAYNNLSDTLPLMVNHVVPSDFGSLSVYYKSTSSTSLVFDGSLVWLGLGSRSFPSALVDGVSFPTVSAPLPDIDSTEFNVIHYDLAPQQIYYDSIWDGIKNLSAVEYFRSGTDAKKISLFLYRPSDGPGDPADWDWYIVMEK